MDEALRKHQERFEADPDATAAFEMLEEHLFMSQAWERLADLYRRRLGAASLAKDPHARAQIQVRLGHLLEDRCGDRDAALEAYSEAARLDPGLHPALQGLRRIYTARCSWEMVLQIGELELAISSDPEERAQLYSGIAEIWGGKLADPDQAAHYRGLARAELGADPAPHPHASPETPAATEERTPERGHGAAAPRSTIASGTVEPSGAAHELPESAPAGVELATEAADPPLDAAEPEAAGPADEDVEILIQRAWLVAARGNSDAALRDLRLALELHPDHVEAIDMMVTVLEGAERHAETAELLDRRAQVAADGETRAAVLTRLGAVREEQLGDLGGARFAYERALAADPGNAVARHGLTRILRLAEDWSGLRNLLETQRAALPEPLRVEVLCELAGLLEEQFGDPQAASSIWSQVLEIEPDEPRARGALARLETAETPDPASESRSADASPDESGSGELRSVRLVGVLERKLEARAAQAADLDPDGVALRLRIAELRSETLEDPGGAIDVLEPALEDDDALVEIAPRLAALYESAERHADLMSLAERAAACAGDPQESAEWYRRAAETARTSGDTGAAVRCYERLLAERPRDRDAEAALLDLHRTRGDTRPLVKLLRAQLARVEVHEEARLHIELAGLLEGPLADPAGAMAHLRRLLEIDPSHADLLEQALRNADAVGGVFAQLDLLDHLRDAEAWPAGTRARVLARRGDLLADTIGWSHEAEQSWRASLALDPGQTRVRDRLSQLG